MIINGLCPGCMKKGAIVFDSEIHPFKEMAMNTKERIRGKFRNEGITIKRKVRRVGKAKVTQTESKEGISQMVEGERL